VGLFTRKPQRLPVAKIGDPVLRASTRPVAADEIGSPDLCDLVDAMVATMDAEGGIGIAAPQVGVSVRLAVIEIPTDSKRYPDAEPFELEVFVNPVMTTIDETEQEYWEGCLSVPDLRGLVARPRAVRVDYQGIDGDSRSISAEGFLATVLQHELDHLDGVLFVDRVRDTTKLATIDEYRKHWLEADDERSVDE
jgi:peptide deformylase